MNEEHRLPGLSGLSGLSDVPLRAVAGEQDAFLAARPRSSDAIAEEAMRRAWQPPRRASLLPYLGAAGVAAGVAFAVAFFVARTGRNDLRFNVAGRAGQAGATLTAQEGVPLPLRFSDGSVLVFQPGTQARVARLTESGAELLLDSGRMMADVRHTGQAHWSVAAGPFKVLVTGTRFEAEWWPSTRKLAVRMFEGAVMVQGPSLGSGLVLRTGESLAVGATSPAVVSRAHAPQPTSPAARAASELAPRAPTVGAPARPPEPTPLAATPAVPSESGRPASHAPAVSVATPSWSELAAKHHYGEALAAAERKGFAHLCRQLDADGLLSLGDTARYASSPARARQAFEALVRRFSHDQRSQDALFALGRLEYEAGATGAAARWFERYLAAAHNPPLGEDAAGRLVEIYDRMGDDAAAVRAARSYLKLFPDGVRARLARRVLSVHSAGEVER